MMGWHYHPQLERYAGVVAELHDLAPERVVSRLLFLGCGEVRTLG